MDCEGRAGTRDYCWWWGRNYWWLCLSLGSCSCLWSLLLVVCLCCRLLARLLDLLQLCLGQSRRVALPKQLLLQELLGLPPRLGPPQADPVVPLHPGQSTLLSW
jgi:hypothetical protein